MIEPCLCGDPYCPNCGNYHTQGGSVGLWFGTGLCVFPQPIPHQFSNCLNGVVE